MATRGENARSDGGEAGDGWKESGKLDIKKADYRETPNPNDKVKKLPQVKGKED